MNLRQTIMPTAHTDADFYAYSMHRHKLSLGVAEDDSLSDCESVVEITESVKLPLFLLHCHKELLDALQSQLITFHEDPDRLSHELVCHLQNIVRQCRTHQHHLSGRWKVPVNIVNLLLETFVQHFIRLVENKHLYVTSAEVAAFDHVEHSTGCPRHDVLSVVQLPDVFTHVCASDTRVALDTHVVTQSQYNLRYRICREREE
jgi:hypothetical protein